MSRPAVIVQRARAAAVEAVLAAAVVGLVEGVRLAIVGDAGVMAALVVAGLGALGAIAITLLVRGGFAALEAVPRVRAWTLRFAGRGDELGLAVWRSVLGAATLAVFAAAAFRVFAWAHEAFRFNDGEPVGLLLTIAVIALAAILVVAAALVDSLLRPRVVPSLGRVLAGPRIWLAALLAIVLVAAVPPLVVGRAVPALPLAGVATIALAVATVLTARMLRAGRARGAQLAAAGIGAAIVAGVLGLGSAPRARGAIVAYGVPSQLAASVLWRLADGDGDGYADGLGGADCDDADPSRHPDAREVPGNGIDENCTGADVTVAALARRTATRPATAPPVRPNILVISVDALRADRLGAWGYGRPTSPRIDAFAATAARFHWAFTSCPSTRCAIPSLFTGRYASTVWTRGGGPAQAPTLAQLARDAGYATSAVVCCSRFASAKGELAGFDMIDATPDVIRMHRPGQSNADSIGEAVIELIGRRDASRPYLMWAHFYDPHFPYGAPEDPDRFGTSASDRYDAEVAYVDAWIGRVLDAVDANTIVVITSDHGEEFGEHGIRFHARSLFNQVARVPLIIRAPGGRPAVIDTPVSIVDIVPTVLDLAGISGPAGMNGVSLAPALRGEPAPARPVYLELLPDHQIERDLIAVVAPPWKVIWDRAANAWSLFSLTDPTDASDQAGAAELPALQRLLLETIDRETSVLP